MIPSLPGGGGRSVPWELQQDEFGARILGVALGDCGFLVGRFWGGASFGFVLPVGRAVVPSASCFPETSPLRSAALPFCRAAGFS